MSDWTEQDFEARRAAHRRGHSIPMRDRAAVDRSYDVANLYLTQFAPDGIVTDDNIDDALDAAWAAAAARVEDSGLSYPGVAIVLPPGTFRPARAHVFPSVGRYELFPHFIGAGSDLTTFVVDSDATASALFTFGSQTHDPDSPLPHFFHTRIGGFSIIAETDQTCLRSGMVVYNPVYCVLYDIRIRGLAHPDMLWTQCYGLQILYGISGGQNVNSQHVKLRDIDVYGCGVGLYVRQAAPFIIDNCTFQGNHFRNCVFDGVLGNWNTGAAQSGQGDTGRWWGGREEASVVSGFAYTTGLPSGTGATCSVQTGQGVGTGGTCVVTCPGASFDIENHGGLWIELTTAGESANEKKVRGLYRVAEVLSATTVRINKGSNHAEQTGLAWQMRGNVGACLMEIANVYDEGYPTRTMFDFSDRQAIRGSRLVFDGNVWSSAGPVVRAFFVDSVAVINAKIVNGAILRYTNESRIDAPLFSIDADAYSTSGLTCREAADSDTYGRAWRGPAGGAAARLRSACQELGAVDIWDARVASSLSLTGADVNSWTGLLNSTVLTPPATKPTYDAADATLGPVVKTATGAGAARSMLRGVVDDTLVPTHDFVCTLVIVMRLPSAVDVTDRRIITQSSGTNTQLQFATSEQPGAFMFQAVGTAYKSYCAPTINATADTDPHVFVAGIGGRADLPEAQFFSDLARADGPSEANAGLHGGSTDLQVSIGTYYDSNDSGELDIAFLAVIPRALSKAEKQWLIDLACNEWSSV